MKTGWGVKALGEVCEVYQPKTIASKQMVPDGKYPVYGANGPIGFFDEYNHEEPQLLVTCRGATCGSVNTSVSFSWINGNAMVVRPKSNELLLDFVKYLFKGAVNFDEIITGSAQPQITRQSLSPIPILLPPLEEQKRIVSILDEAFEGLDRARENAEANLKNVRELFDATFNSLLTLSKNKIPAEWSTSPLGKLCENLDSKRVPITKNKRVKGSIPYYGASGIVDYVQGHIFDEPLLLISEDGANLLARTYNIAFSIEGKTWVNNHAHVLRFDNSGTRRYIELYLNSIPLDSYISGMAQPKLNQKKLTEISIPIPNLLEQRRIVGLMDDCSNGYLHLEASFKAKLQDISDLRQSLLQKAFAGELT